MTPDIKAKLAHIHEFLDGLEPSSYLPDINSATYSIIFNHNKKTNLSFATLIHCPTGTLLSLGTFPGEVATHSFINTLVLVLRGLPQEASQSIHGRITIEVPQVFFRLRALNQWIASYPGVKLVTSTTKDRAPMKIVVYILLNVDYLDLVYYRRIVLTISNSLNTLLGPKDKPHYLRNRINAQVTSTLLVQEPGIFNVRNAFMLNVDTPPLIPFLRTHAHEDNLLTVLSLLHPNPEHRIDLDLYYDGALILPDPSDNDLDINPTPAKAPTQHVKVSMPISNLLASELPKKKTSHTTPRQSPLKTKLI